MIRVRLVALSFTLLLSAAFASDGPAAEFADPFISGTGGYHTYRIPALAVTKEGTVLAFCEARKNSGRDDGDIDLVMKRSTDHGKTWSAMALVHEAGGGAEITIGNPSPVVERKTGLIHLLFTRNNQRLFHTYTSDDGRTFAPPVEITGMLREFDFPWTRLGAGPGHGIQLRNGRLLIPIWLNEKIHHNYRSAAVYSDDSGKTWEAGGLVGPEIKDPNECMMFERADGSVVANMRASGSKKRSVALSREGGRAWSIPEHVGELVDPVCQASVLRLRSGQGRVLFANPASAEKRVNMTVRLSYDEGKTWPVAKVLHRGPSGYSDLAQANDGTILCLYECGETRPTERIRLARFRLEWLTDLSRR